ncbi:glycoside hydrolase family 43 [Lecanosticta acicola]|uniref:Endo-1,5-alpha-L-arabinanase A n=1 Tax=Lecanosticta acicola TaxID=111012 RepID=A0AAI9EBV9_9PEZI|nr:glycoside hydrolase family 43 [Lecanosticta acicola]
MLSSTLTALLAVVGLATATAIGNHERSNTARQATADYEGYMFAYFTGNTVEGEKIYFAASNGNDALDWAELDGGKPVLASTKGTTGLRDPFIMRSQDGGTFYLLATDLSIGSGTSWGDSVRNGSRYLEIWESNDLVTWSEQRHVLVSPPTAGMTWAPEAHYDTAIDQYVVYWSSALYAEDDPGHTGTSYNRMLYATTTDFVTFSKPQIWQDSGLSRIDSTVLQVDDTYYRFTKDEGGAATGCTDIIQESSQDLLAQVKGWKTVASCIGKKAGLKAVEGPTSFKSNPGDVHGDHYYLFVDEYGGRGYIPLQTANISQPDWQVPSAYKLPARPRHGTVLPITAAELLRLQKASSA